MIMIVDFGALKPLRAALEDHFDHVTAVALDDPKLSVFQALQDEHNIARVKVFEDGVGCEKFAKKAFDLATAILLDVAPGTWVISAECFEHEGNSAMYTNPTKY